MNVRRRRPTQLPKTAVGEKIFPAQSANFFFRGFFRPQKPQGNLLRMGKGGGQEGWWW